MEKYGKIINGKLEYAPKVYKGVINFDKSIKHLNKYEFLPIREFGEGSFRKVYESDGYVCIESYDKKKSYSELRKEQYPELGDVVDALLKAYEGDSAELESIIKKRRAIKRAIKKC